MDRAEESRSVQTDVSMIVSASGDSINYPYRSILKDISFPRCHFMAEPGNSSEAYHRALSMLGYGSPLWDPIGKLFRPEIHLNSGVSIGDVGFLNNNGNFEYFFNVFLPPDDPGQYQCPSDLIPLDPPLDSELSINPIHFPAGTALISKGIEISTLSSSPLDLKFTVKAREGGILVLPDGASREDLISMTRIRNFVLKHALKWYVYFKEILGNIVVHPNGTLYVVTGTNKATNWATCVTHNIKPRFHRLRRSPTITYRGENEGSAHQWEATLETRKELAFQRSRPIEHIGKCTLFVRGIRFGISIADWTKDVLQYEVPDMLPFTIIRTIPTLGFRARIQTLKECLFGYTEKCPLDDGLTMRVTFHPLDVILRLLLETSSSNVAHLEDHIWCSVVNKSDANVYSIIHLLMHILETHETLEENGNVTLVPKRLNAQAPPAPTVSLLRIPTYIKQRYLIKRQQRETWRNLAKVFPGPGIPSAFFRSIG